MAKCKSCGKSGFFLSVNKHGYCDTCAALILIQIRRSVEIINDSNSIISKSKNPKTIVGRLDVIIQHSQQYIDLESQGLQIFDAPIDTILNNSIENTNEVLFEIFEEKYKKTKEKINALSTGKSKVGVFEKFVNEAIDFKSYFNNKGGNYNEYISKIDLGINEIKVLIEE